MVDQVELIEARPNPQLGQPGRELQRGDRQRHVQFPELIGEQRSPIEDRRIENKRVDRRRVRRAAQKRADDRPAHREAIEDEPARTVRQRPLNGDLEVAPLRVAEMVNAVRSSRSDPVVAPTDHQGRQSGVVDRRQRA